MIQNLLPPIILVEACSSYINAECSVPDFLRSFVPSWTYSVFREDCIAHDICYACVSLLVVLNVQYRDINIVHTVPEFLYDDLQLVFRVMF